MLHLLSQLQHAGGLVHTNLWMHTQNGLLHAATLHISYVTGINGVWNAKTKRLAI